MTPIEFCYWLQGALELGGNKSFSEEQVQVLNEHLNLVFAKVTSPTKLPKIGPGVASPGLTPLDGIRQVPWVGPYLPPVTNTPYTPNQIWCSNNGQTPRFTPRKLPGTETTGVLTTDSRDLSGLNKAKTTLSDAISLASSRETIVADLKKCTLSLQC